MLNECYIGDCVEGLERFAAEGISVQTCITSPPYWGLRDYGHDGAYGLEQSLYDYLDRMVAVFRAVRDVLADDGTVWLNMGDGYANDGKWDGETGGKQAYLGERNRKRVGRETRTTGLKPKNLIGQPWRLAFALQDDGWFLRQDIIWHKPNPMPESVRDRCTKSHEYLFLLTKSERYFYDFEAMQEPVSGTATARGSGVNPKSRYKTPDGWDTSVGEGGHGSFHKKGREKGKPAAERKSKPRAKQNESFSGAVTELVEKRNRRSVWTIAAEPFADAHFATFPRALVAPCILAGSRPGDIVLDPFMGSGTTAQVAEHLGRRWIGCEINPDYVEMQRSRLRQQSLTLVIEQ